jgi:hypothetical protein
VDANHGEIIAALRDIGAAVTDTSAVGGGFPDLVVSYRQRWHLIEIKDGAKSPSKRRLTPEQATWHRWQQAKIHVATSVEEAIRVITGAPPNALPQQQITARQALGDDLPF